MNYGIDWSRIGEVALMVVVAFAATIARVCFGVVNTKDYPPADPEMVRLWKQRMAWALAGELAAIVLFVLVAEAVVILRGYSGPTGVLLGAGAAVLGYPFISGAFRKRVASRLNLDESP